MNESNPLSFNKHILEYWRAAGRAEFTRKEFAEKLKQLIVDINPLMAKINKNFKFNPRDIGGGSYISSDDGNTQCYILIPVYPINQATMGPFFIRTPHNDGRYCVNTNKINSLEHLAEVLGDCLTHSENIEVKYIRHGIIITEAELKKILSAQY